MQFLKISEKKLTQTISKKQNFKTKNIQKIQNEEEGIRVNSLIVYRYNYR